MTTSENCNSSIRYTLDLLVDVLTITGSCYSTHSHRWHQATPTQPRLILREQFNLSNNAPISNQKTAPPSYHTRVNISRP